TRVQDLLDSPTPADLQLASLIEAVEQRRRVDEKDAPIVAQLQADIQRLLMSISNAARSALHRTTQRRLSDPSLVIGQDVEAISFARTFAPNLQWEDTTAGDAATRLDALDVAIRVAEESLQKMHTVRHLLTEIVSMETKIAAAEIPATLKDALRAYLAMEGDN